MTNINDARNLTLLMDFYELTMAAGYFEEGYTDKVGVFDMFFRKIPDGGGFAIAAGLEQFCEVVDNLHFSEEDIEYLRGKGCFSEQFLDYLRRFEFHCNIWAVAEGTPIFPHEPIVIVEGPAIEAQLIETLLLVTFNHQSLIATKTNRIVRAAQGRPVMEFGSRRAQGYDAAVLGARAAYIGGVVGTACVMADRQFGIPALGTMAHSWVQMFPSEYEAFKRYAELYPDNCTLLVDTYSVVKSGVPNAIRVFDEVLKPLGIRPKGVRIDSGDIAYHHPAPEKPVPHLRQRHRKGHGRLHHHGGRDRGCDGRHHLVRPGGDLEKAYLYQRARRTAEPSHLCERKARVRKPAAAGYPGFLRRSGGDSVG